MAKASTERFILPQASEISRRGASRSSDLIVRELLGITGADKVVGTVDGFGLAFYPFGSLNCHRRSVYG